jgi:hypothetical protein
MQRDFLICLSEENMTHYLSTIKEDLVCLFLSLSFTHSLPERE